MQDKGFIFDYAKCVGCHACIVGCFNENKTNSPVAWRQVNSSNQKKIPLAGFVNLSIACNHCEEAPCKKFCPANAYNRDLITGAVIHQPEKCIGCKYCTWTCPFDAPKYNAQKGIVEKCHLCSHRVEKDQKPACAVQCPTGALSFGSIDKKEVFGIPITSCGPLINTLNSSVINNIPEIDLNSIGFDKANIKMGDKPNEKIHAGEEWPLVLFTLIYAFLSGWIFAFTRNIPSLYSYIFIALGVVGIVLSAFHLGKPLRAARSILNLKNSWLSREIMFSGLFFSSAFIYLFLMKTTTMLVITTLLSLLLLVSLEMVYSITKIKFKTPIHSANTILTALLFGFFFASIYKIFVLILVVKGLLYLVRKKDDSSLLKPINSIIMVSRFMIGIMVPLSIVLFQNHMMFEVVLITIILGELIDRFEFYNDIYIDTPERVLYLQNVSKVEMN